MYAATYSDLSVGRVDSLMDHIVKRKARSSDTGGVISGSDTASYTVTGEPLTDGVPDNG